MAFDQTPNNTNGQTGNSGGNGLGGTSGSAGGTGGLGGSSSDGGNFGGGGGFSGSGVTATTRGGRSFLSSAEGGTSGSANTQGGFGGGGGVSTIATNDRRYAGGGGGYSGGGAAHSNLSTTLATSGAAGGGGGSYNNGSNPINLAGINEGNGRVRIKFIQPPCVSALIPVQIIVDELPEPDPISSINTQCGSTAVIAPTGSSGYYQFYTDAAGQHAIGIGSSFTTGTLFGDTTLYVAAIPAGLPLIVLDTFVFTNAGKTGFSGPSQSDINSAYNNTNLSGLVTVNEPGIQKWIVPATGFYRIKAAGASGAVTGGSGEPGLGATMEGTFFLVEGQILNIAVGQEGSTGSTPANGGGGGGGGGSFVVFDGATADEHILLIAGGGGTCVGKANNGIANGKTSSSGSDGERNTGVYAGGFDGRGAEGQQNTAGGGGGFGGLTSCSGHPGQPNCGDAFNTSPNSDGNRGAGFIATGLSHNEKSRGGSTGGGFGGGGGANTASAARAGGGGGYSGGGGATNNGNPVCSGGGGSYNAGFNQLNYDGANQGHGRVEIVMAEILCKSDIIPVNIVVDAIDPPTITGASVICIDTMVMLTASGSNGTYAWYDDALATNLLDTGAVFITPILSSSATYYAKAITFNLTDTIVYHFTNAGQTGRFGPNQAAIDAAYANTNLAGQVTVTTPGIQEWIVPADGLYKISAAGASGAPIGTPQQTGLGALMEGYFELTAGQKLNIAVGQQGAASGGCGGGGGGTFVVYDGATSDSDILVIAGGGGTCRNQTNTGIAHGQSTNSGANGQRSTGVWAGGFDGRGGEGSQNTVGGGGGFGGLTVCSGHPGQPDCGDAYNSTTNSDSRRGGGFISTAAQTSRSNGGDAFGGFGGGGGANAASAGRIGGGGGYSGGGAGFVGNDGSPCSGGGGSFNAGINQNNISGFNSGHGYVTISAVSLNINCESPLQAHEISYYSVNDEVTLQGAGSYCLGQEAELTATGTAIPQDIWEWYENSLQNTPFLTGQNSAVVTPNNSTEYILRIPIVGLGCLPLVSDTITVSVPTPNNNLSLNNATATCKVNQSGWIHFIDEYGNLVVSINSNGQNLGYVTATTFVQDSPLLVADCEDSEIFTSVLDRHWAIIPEFNNPGSPILIRLPLKQSELDSIIIESQNNLNPEDDVTGIDDLKLSKYSGPVNVDSDFSNNCDVVGGVVQIIQLADNGLIKNTESYLSNHDDEDLFVEFSIFGFSEFWLHGGDNSALPVSFSDFSVDCNNGVTTIQWITESESNASHFDLLKSANGSDWNIFKTVAAVGNSTTQYLYQVEDRLFGELVYYQLKQHDINGQVLSLNPISSSCSTHGSFVELFPNPASDMLLINFRSEDKNINIEKLEFTDVQGRMVNMDYSILTGNQAQVEVQNLFDGVYVVKIFLNNNNIIYERFAKH